MIVDQYGKPMQDSRGEVQRLRGQINRLRARYDSARTYEGNQLHWANADTLGPNAANSYAVRKKLRSRSRYEVVENNSYLRGMVLSRANDMVGTGPKLQIQDPRITPERANMIEARFGTWTRAIKLRRLVWQLAMAKMIDGEGFAVEITNPRLPNEIKLDYRVVEADQCTTQYITDEFWRTRNVDGIQFDEWDNPLRYFFLKEHPGAEQFYGTMPTDGSWVRGDMVLHWFRRDRPWKRGIPELTSSLPLCAILRRYTLAVLQSAEVAADFAGVLESQGPPNTNAWSTSGGQLEDDPFDTFPVDKGMFTTLPWGYTLRQMKAEQPTAVYDKFVDALLREIARPLLMPFNLAVGFSGGYNFASGTLDRQMYQGSLKIERTSCEEDMLDPILRAWWFEASRTPDVLGQALQDVPSHSWRWDYLPDHADPVKSTEALRLAWEYGFITDDQIQKERYNRDLEEHYAAVEQQKSRRDELELPQPSAMGNFMDSAEGAEDAENLEEGVDAEA